MRQNTKKKRSGFGYFIRMFLLLVELLAVTLFLWGNDAYSISATTPEFKWENYKTIAHALGGIGDKTYLNSKESFLAGYQMGCRLFEVDLVKTSDNVWVCRHSWYQSLGQWEGDEKKVLSSEEFLSRPIYGKYTPITFEDLLVLLSDYPDTFVMLDSKQYSVRNYQKTVEDYADYIELAEAAGVPDVMGQIIPEIYNQAMFAGTALLYDFPGYIYSLWQEYSTEELTEIAAFCKEKNIQVQAWSPLGRGTLLRHALLEKIAAAHGKTPAQVALRWCIERGIAPIPKSTLFAHQQENLNVFDFSLTPEEVNELTAMPQTSFSGLHPDTVTF